MVSSTELRWVEHADRMRQTENNYIILVEKFVGRRVLEEFKKKMGITLRVM
jgi:hypothetical protein